MRIGIVGCGRMGNERARAATTLGHELAVLYDSDLERARELARRHPAGTVSARDGDMPWSDLDAVFICTPPSMRTKYELAAIEAELPFFIEKPIAVESADVLTILEALRIRPTIHAVGYMNRCRESILFARRLLARCHLLGICCHWVGRSYKVDWWLQPDQSGGPLNEQATHAFDLFRFLVGEVHSVVSLAATSEGSSDLALSIACTLDFERGQLGNMFYSCEAEEKQINLRVITKEGLLELSGWELRMTANTINGVVPGAMEEDIFLVETKQFLTAVELRNPELIPCDLTQAYRSQRVVDAARASLRTRQRVVTAMTGTEGRR